MQSSGSDILHAFTPGGDEVKNFFIHAQQPSWMAAEKLFCYHLQTQKTQLCTKHKKPTFRDNIFQEKQMLLETRVTQLIFKNHSSVLNALGKTRCTQCCRIVCVTNLFHVWFHGVLSEQIFSIGHFVYRGVRSQASSKHICIILFQTLLERTFQAVLQRTCYCWYSLKPTQHTGNYCNVGNHWGIFFFSAVMWLET